MDTSKGKASENARHNVPRLPSTVIGCTRGSGDKEKYFSTINGRLSAPGGDNWAAVIVVFAERHFFLGMARWIYQTHDTCSDVKGFLLSTDFWRHEQKVILDFDSQLPNSELSGGSPLRQVFTGGPSSLEVMFGFVGESQSVSPRAIQDCKTWRTRTSRWMRN